MTNPKADDIVLARRKKGYGAVSTDHGTWAEGETVPMRYAEAKARDDCEPVLGKAQQEEETK